jgi:hypothetical protein
LIDLDDAMAKHEEFIQLEGIPPADYYKHYDNKIESSYNIQ